MKKNQPASDIQIEKLNWSDNLGENPIIQWISQNGKMILWLLIGSLIVILLYYRFTSGPNKGRDSDYIAAQTDFQIFQQGIKGKKDPSAQSAALDRLSLILNRRKELQPKYDGLIAQTLLNQNDLKIAMGYIERTFKRTKPNQLIFYQDYAQNSLLISQEKYEEALKQALNLKQQMFDNYAVFSQDPDKKEFGDALYLYNLLRIAMLSQQIGDLEREKESWAAFLSSTEKSETNMYPVSKQIFNLVQTQFQQGSISLQNYIESREKELK